MKKFKKYIIMFYKRRGVINIKNPKILRAIYIALLIGVVILLYLWWGAKNSRASEKVDICHYDGRSGNYQTLNVDEHAAKEHLKNHDNDYKGKCNTEYHWFKKGGEKVGDCTGACESREGTQTHSQSYECKKVNVGEEGGGGNECKKDEKTTKEWTEACVVEEPTACEEPSPEPQPSPTPEQPKGFSESGAPQCTDGSTILLPANVHVVRHGTSADVNFFITQGDSANIYYKEVGENDWTHSALRDDVAKYKGTDGYVSYPVRDLKLGVGYVFGVQQVQGCGGGQTVTAVVVDGPQSVTFPFSYWEWLK